MFQSPNVTLCVAGDRKPAKAIERHAIRARLRARKVVRPLVAARLHENTYTFVRSPLLDAVTGNLRKEEIAGLAQRAATPGREDSSHT
jgi:hypothetical protein